MKIILDYLNLAFTLIFVAEAMIKILAFGVRYFKDSWNRFDFIIAFASLLSNILEFAIGLDGAAATTGIRAFRIAKFFQVFRKSSKINIIFQTFITTLPALINVGSLLLLLVFIFGILT